jgi:RND family efflux transporter MFP subunit
MKNAVCALAVVAAIFSVACSKDDGAAPPTAAKSAAPIVVELASPSPIARDRSIRVSGVLSADAEVRLSFKTGGIIKRVLVEAGDEVKRGQVLAELDLTELNAGATQTREGLRKAERDYARAQSLYTQDVIAKAQLDDAKTALDVARAANVATNFNANIGRLLASEAGKVTRRFVEANEVVAPSAPVLSIAQSGGEKLLKVSLSDVDAVRLKLGDRAEVQFDALPNQIFVARVHQLAGAANAMTSLFEVELAIDGDLGRLNSGAIGQARIVIDAPPENTAVAPAVEQLAIPIAAIVEANLDQALVYVFEAPAAANQPARARARTVQIGEIVGARVLVLGGLQANEQLVVRGASYLEDGLAVEVAKSIAAVP